MELQYFMGANSASGFVSHYEELNRSCGEKLTRLIKGGAGCGKSTLMKKVAAYAAANALDTVLIPCASDPNSLDAVVIPAAGYAITDATAPHILEPRFCGCSELYLNMSGAYNLELQEKETELAEIQSCAKACYAKSKNLLQAVAALDAAESGRTAFSDDLAQSIATLHLPQTHGKGTAKHCFLSAFTPFGYLSFGETIQKLADQVYLLHGSRRDVSQLLRQIAHNAIECGWDILIGDSPLLPGVYTEQIIVPQRRIAFIRNAAEAPWQKEIVGEWGFDIDESMQLQIGEHVAAALHEAKELHDKLEEICAPYVDFSVSKRLAQDCILELESLLA